MSNRISLAGFLGASTLAIAFFSGCGPSTELTGTPIPNALPDTRVTGQPPELTEAGFIVRFHWTGFDADGRIARYQWKISNNGTNGISVQDTLTFCPVSGDTLNPWFESTATDSTFFVTADIPDFPGDQSVPGLNRSFQTHTFWVRAIDDKGGVDPTPAHVSFTSTTLLPTVGITTPTGVVGQTTAKNLPSTVTLLFDGSDADFVTGLPTKVRYLWKRARLPGGGYVFTRDTYNANVEYLVSFADSAWSPWFRYERNEDLRRVVLPGQPRLDELGNTIYYLFALQVQDTAGAVSIGRSYGQQVANIRIDNSLAPSLTVVETYLPRMSGAGLGQQREFDIAQGQPLNFFWSADASDYAGTITSYRYGWNVADVTDPNDPGWALPEGNTSQHRRAPQIAFASGVHRLTVQATDNSNQSSRWTVVLNVVPVPDPENQLPLLWIDDVSNDRNSNNWPSQAGIPLDRDEYRDGFWLAALTGSGGVAGWNPELHQIDSEINQVTYRQVVDFRNILWIGRWLSTEAANTVGNQFRPGGAFGQDDIDKYIWLTPYQNDVGNVLFAASSGQRAFLAAAGYEMPIVFESREVIQRFGYTNAPGPEVRRSFGERELPDGTTVRVGPTRYPYAINGISLIDVVTDGGLYEFGVGQLLSSRRRTNCAGVKGVRLDPVFKATYLPGGAVFPDTIWADPVIGWRDLPADVDGRRLERQFPWGADEFYDADIVGRGTPYTPQVCEGGVLCVEPMFRTIARYDWIRAERLRVNPNDTWPVGYYGGQGQPTLSSVCGSNALNIDRTSARTNDRITAFIARKTAPNKPSQIGDVIMGFDPYRFNNAQMRQVVRWLLDEHFGLTMNP